MGEPTVHVVVIALVVDPRTGLLLVQKRDDGQWCCPQGWMRPGETLKETAKRKVSEETGVLVSVDGLLAMRSVLGPGEPPQGLLQVLVRCRPMAGAPRPGVFELDAAYRPLHDLPELRDGLQDWIVDALAGQAPILE